MKQNLNETYCWYSIGLYPKWNILLEKTVPKNKTVQKTFYHRPDLFIFPSCLEKGTVDGCIEM